VSFSAALIVTSVAIQAPADTLRAAVERHIAASGAAAAVYFRSLRGADSLAINADTRYHAASTMKVAVMIQVFRDADAGLLGLRDEVEVTNRFRSIADSSTFSLEAADDSDSSLYRRIGQRARIGELVELMIRVSSNLATNILIERVGAQRVQATLRSLGADSVAVLRGVEDGAAFRAGMNNSVTARGLGVLLRAIADGEAASARSCGAMLDILLGQRFRDGIPSGLPRRTRVAHKTGTITALHHDAGVVYVGGRPAYVLVILTRGLARQEQSAALMGDLARLFHIHVTRADYVRSARPS